MSVFWYPQLARPLPRSGRIPRTMYNTPTNHPRTSHTREAVDRDSISMPAMEREPTFFKTYGLHFIISILLFGIACFAFFSGFQPSFYHEVRAYQSLSGVLFPFFIFGGLSAAFCLIPAVLFWRQRARRRKLDALPVDPPKPARDSFFY